VLSAADSVPVGDLVEEAVIAPPESDLEAAARAIFGLVVGVGLLLTRIGLVILAFAVFGREPEAAGQRAPITTRPVTG